LLGDLRVIPLFVGCYHIEFRLGIGDEHLERFYQRIALVFARLRTGLSSAFLLEGFDGNPDVSAFLLDKDTQLNRLHAAPKSKHNPDGCGDPDLSDARQPFQ
jgi:hypothetical protein